MHKHLVCMVFVGFVLFGTHAFGGNILQESGDVRTFGDALEIGFTGTGQVTVPGRTLPDLDPPFGVVIIGDQTGSNGSLTVTHSFPR